MKDNLSPEEKLLNLIRGGKKPKSSNIPLQQAPEKQEQALHPTTPKTGTLLPRNVPVLKIQFSSLRNYFSNVSIQKFLFVLLAISVLYLLASIVYPFIALKNVKLPAVSLQNSKEQLPLPKEEPKPYEFYLDSTKQRQIFSNSANPSSEVAAAIATSADSIKDINLVGIILGDNPQAVIEDKKAQKTFSVSKGQFIGDYQVEDILQGKIILNNKGQRTELGL